MRTGVVAAALLALAGLGLGVFLGTHIRGKPNAWLDEAQAVAEHHGWEGGRIDAELFQLTAFRDFEDAGDDLLVVYIEGDGRAWESLTEVSSDPTPRHPRVLELAVQDPAANVAYLARPCQYLPTNEGFTCSPFFWTLSRYADFIIASLDTAIDSLKREAGATHVRLVGVSGGGTLAVLVAAKRDDVTGIVTVGANLDHDLWTERLGLTPLVDSLNPIEITEMVEDIPQVHFLGAEDEVVTRAEIDSFVAHMTDDSRVEIVVVPGYDHICCWAERWPALLAEHMP